jgi:peptidoglycan-N-acetylglucosamine deacetylase
MSEGRPNGRRFGQMQLLVIAVSAAVAWNFSGQFVQASSPVSRPTIFQPSSVPQVLAAAKPPTAVTLASPPADVNCAQVACLALTFDDGPNPDATPLVLSALEQAQVPATFFVVGSRAATLPGLLQQMHRDGDEIGDHSWSHPDMTTLSPDQVAAQISMTQAAVVAAGVPAPTLFRPPYGAINDVMKSQIQLPFILWNDDPVDWQTLNPAKVVAATEAQAQPGAIVELHDIYQTTGQAMPQLISDLKQHYQLVTVSQLLDLEPGQTGEYFSR